MSALSAKREGLPKAYASLQRRALRSRADAKRLISARLFASFPSETRKARCVKAANQDSKTGFLVLF